MELGLVDIFAASTQKEDTYLHPCAVQELQFSLQRNSIASTPRWLDA